MTTTGIRPVSGVRPQISYVRENHTIFKDSNVRNIPEDPSKSKFSSDWRSGKFLSFAKWSTADTTKGKCPIPLKEAGVSEQYLNDDHAVVAPIEEVKDDPYGYTGNITQLHVCHNDHKTPVTKNVVQIVEVQPPIPVDENGNIYTHSNYTNLSTRDFSPEDRQYL